MSDKCKFCDQVPFNGIYDGNACGMCAQEKIKAPHLVFYYLKLEAENEALRERLKKIAISAGAASQLQDADNLRAMLRKLATIDKGHSAPQEVRGE